jgi:hypothetical protein
VGSNNRDRRRKIQENRTQNGQRKNVRRLAGTVPRKKLKAGRIKQEKGLSKEEKEEKITELSKKKVDQEGKP